jgi:hypothetical protein
VLQVSPPDYPFYVFTVSSPLFTPLGIQDLSHSGIPMDLFFQFFISLITKQEAIHWTRAIRVLCEEVTKTQERKQQQQPSGKEFHPNGPINPLNGDLITQHDHTPVAVYDSHSSHYLNLLAARYEKNYFSSFLHNNYFDNNIRLQWRASRYEYFQQSSVGDKSSSSSFSSSPTSGIQFLVNLVNQNETQFVSDTIVCFICLLIVTGVDTPGLRIFLLVILFLETATRYLGKSWKRFM